MSSSNQKLQGTQIMGSSMKIDELYELARIIRNYQDISVKQKEDLTSMLADYCIRKHQFFDKKRFVTVATQTLPEGWPRNE